MKTITFLAAAVLMVSTAQASEIINSGAGFTSRFSFDEPIAFNERGVEFFIFPNGEFDFNTAQTAQTITTNTYYRYGRRNTINATYGAPGVNVGTRIEHDQTGKIRRIGNVFLNYDNAGRIKRIGSVYMIYNNGALTQIGGMRITYNRRGNVVAMTGNVKAFISTPYVYHNDYNYNPSENTNNDHYYYRQNGTKAVIETPKKAVTGNRS